MIGNFITNRKPNPVRALIRADDIETGYFRLFACVFGKPGHGDRGTRSYENAAVALIEPLRLDALLSWRRPSPFDPQTKHAHRVRQGFLGSLLVHFVASRRTTQVGQPGSGNQAM